MSSFRPLDIASVAMPVPTGQLVITSQVPAQTATNISVTITNHLVEGTNQDVCGCPTCHEWVDFVMWGQPKQSVG